MHAQLVARIYKNGAQTSACGAAFSDNKWSIPMFRADFPASTSKSVEVVPKLPPPAFSTDGKGAYRQAMLKVWGKVPEYSGRGRPPTQPQSGEDWKYLQIIKKHEGSKLVDIIPKVIYGDSEEVKKLL